MSFWSPACRRFLHGLAPLPKTHAACQRFFGSSLRPGVSFLSTRQSHWSERSNSRFLSTSSGNGGKDDDTKSPEQTGGGDDADDPFGVSYRDGDGNLGKPPPSFRRDTATGKFTGEIEAEVTDEERKLLSLTHVERGKALADRFVTSWNEAETDETGESGRQAEVAAKIRAEEMALNTLGRRVADVAEAMKKADVKGLSSSEKKREEADDSADHDGFSAPLSPSEFSTFRHYLEKEHGITDVSEEDIPVARTSTNAGSGARDGIHDSDPDLDLTWLTAAARSEVEGMGGADDPFVDLMPSDLNPARKVNRKRAKPVPKQLLHHNNLSLLRRYVTPGGQIMNRVQSRLGAKDQRKIAKLVKRARHLGLIPYVGQWKLEDHGNIHEADIGEDREWEKDLVRRGLVERERWREEK